MAKYKNLTADTLIYTGSGKVYGFIVNSHTSGTLLLADGINTASASAVAASGTITSDNTNVADGDTVTIGSKTYTFKTALTPTEGEVLIGASADASLLNLIRAINHTGTPNTDYKCAAANTQVSAASSVTSHAFAVTALTTGFAGNSIATTETSSHLSWGSTTLTGGLDASNKILNTFTYPTGSGTYKFPEAIEFYTGLYADVSNTQDITVVYDQNA